MFKRVEDFISKPVVIVVILTIITLAITAQSLLLPLKTFVEGGLQYTHYNNYIIFKQSFFHLISNRDLYQLYPAEHWDYYKYSPAFALAMAPLAVMPDWLGLFTWNLLNVLVLFWALWKMPLSGQKRNLLALVFVLIELITSIQNSQSNALIAGLMMFAFMALENGRIAIASLLIVITVFIKLFGIVAFAMFIFYPGKFRAVAYTLGWTVILGVLPLLVVSPEQLSFLYKSWVDLLKNDHSVSWGFSVAGWLYTWFGLQLKNVIVLAGALIFCLPLIRFKMYGQYQYRLFFLASIMIWVVIFNHKAESPTFVIAVSGIALWFFGQQVKTVNLILLALAVIFTILSPTDIFPKYIRSTYVVPYALKAVPCILIWAKIIADVMLYNPAKQSLPEYKKS